jgi:regulator of nucleoside diphosphate kinase
MIARSMLSPADSVITETDFDRLSGVIDSPRYRATHSVLLRTLKDELARRKVVASNEVSRGIVTMHSRVQVLDVKSGESETYTLVYPDEADIDEGKLSILAPLGTALLGTRIGQTIKFEAPAGTRKLRIEKILYQPEAAGDFHL